MKEICVSLLRCVPVFSQFLLTVTFFMCCYAEVLWLLLSNLSIFSLRCSVLKIGSEKSLPHSKMYIDIDICIWI